jgi:hypothetical protein
MSRGERFKAVVMLISCLCVLVSAGCDASSTMPVVVSVRSTNGDEPLAGATLEAVPKVERVPVDTRSLTDIINAAAADHREDYLRVSTDSEGEATLLLPCFLGVTFDSPLAVRVTTESRTDAYELESAVGATATGSFSTVEVLELHPCGTFLNDHRLSKSTVR